MSVHRLLLPIGTVLLAACSSSPSTLRGNEDPRLDRLVDTYYEEMLKRNPLIATFIGDPRYDDRLANNIAPEYVASNVALHRRYLEAAQKIDSARLSPSAQLTLAVFERECTETLAGAEFPGYLMPVDQLGSLPSTFAELGAGDNAQPFATVRDYENFLARGRDFSVWVDQAIANMRVGIKQGFVQPRGVMEKVLPQLKAMLVEEAGQSLFYKPIANMPKEFSAADRSRLAKEYTEAITHRIIPVYRRLHDFIRDEYLPHTRSAVAWTALPKGVAWYRYLVRNYTTTELDAAEIHRIGLREVARIRGEMSKVQAVLNIPGELKDFFTALALDQSQYYRTAADVLAAHRAIKAKIDGQLGKLFADFPKADYEIREVEAFRAQSSAGAFYQPPSSDSSRRGIFYVNTYNLKAQPKFGMTTLSLHEASPGHHFQLSIQQEIADLPRFRRFLVGYTAYVEGWALYSESLGKEMGLFDDPYSYFGHLNDEMLRAMRLVVDTGLHTMQWTRERAIAYLLDNSYMAPTDAEAEVERYIANPGQALGYKIGQLKIRELRAQAENALGTKFDIKQFHGQVLRDGALPLGILGEKITRWIERQKQ